MEPTTNNPFSLFRDNERIPYLVCRIISLYQVETFVALVQIYNFKYYLSVLFDFMQKWGRLWKAPFL